MFHNGRIFHCDCDRQGRRRGHAESGPVVVVIALSRKIPVREFCIERGMGGMGQFQNERARAHPKFGHLVPTSILRQSNVND